MTSASELFYTRRSRYGRSTAADDLGGFQPLSPDRNSHHTNTYSYAQNRRHQRHLLNGDASGGANHRHDFDACDPLRRSAPHVRHNLCHRFSLQDRAGFQLDEVTSQFVSGSRINLENFSSGSRPRLTGNERLPGTVLLARARLLERLRGVPPPGSRPGSGGRFRIFGAEAVLDDHLRPVEARDRRTENLTGGSANGFPSTDLSSETERPGLLQEPNRKPDGLTQEALDCLHLELFSSTEIAVKDLVSRASLDCSICLESFVQGDELIRLPCGHRFHAVCLDPWVRVRGDCPYCRSVIVVTNQRAKSST